VKRLLILTMVATVCPGTLIAQKADGPIILDRVGSASCGTWTAARAAQKASDYEFWMLGYIAAAGAITHDKGPGRGSNPFRNVDWTKVYSWIDNYRRENPRSLLINAPEAFMKAHPRG
jgi:hypothetical protein